MPISVMAGAPVPSDALHPHSRLTPLPEFSHVAPVTACVSPTGHAQSVMLQAAIRASRMLVVPVTFSRVSSPFGGRIHPVRGKQHWHTGIDLVAPSGTPVHVVAQGVVKAIAFERRGYGRYVTISHPYGSDTIYAHLSATTPGLRVGDTVSAGERIGSVGMTGTATGPHLHFELRRQGVAVDPTPLLIQTVRVALVSTKALNDCSPAHDAVPSGLELELDKAGVADPWKYSPL
ncbi:M23 family metallopeptidase [Pandoraea sp. NPDC087047]|uniref:M23 family metallopeptidase n=1 Tax=Pandoraea sp. NPDC087047 TaxID=3364390 RepID=UPI00382C87C1